MCISACVGAFFATVPADGGRLVDREVIVELPRLVATLMRQYELDAEQEDTQVRQRLPA